MTTFYSAEYDENSLNAEAAEACLNQAASSSKKIHEITLKNVIAKCKLSPIGRKHYKSAYQFLVEDFGSTTYDGRTKITSLDDNLVPEKVATDLILGLDLVINFLGYKIGIDITTHESFLGKKLHKQRSLAKVYDENFHLDFTVILIQNQRFTGDDLEILLKKVIRNSNSSCQVINLV